MGVDIHAISIVGKYVIHDVPECFVNGFRYSELFSELRTYAEAGFPIEAQGSWFLEEDEDSSYYTAEFGVNEEYFGDSTLTYADVCRWLKDQEQRYFVSEAWLDRFYALGGVLPEGMDLDIIDEENYLKYWFDEIKSWIESKARIYEVDVNDIKIVFNFDC